MEEETYSYKGWLNSDSFLKRMCAVFGYSTLFKFSIIITLAASYVLLNLFIKIIY